MRSLDHLPLSDRYEVRFATEDDLPDLAEVIARHIPGIPKNILESGQLIHSHDSESIFVAFLDGKMAGGAIVLYLNDAGFAQLRSGSFPYGNPDVNVLSNPGQPPAAIYVSILCLPHGASEAVGNMMRWLQRRRYREADIFSHPITDAGRRFDRGVGFVECGCQAPDLLVYRRQSPSEQ